MFFWQIGLGLAALEVLVFYAVIAKIGAAKTFLLWILSAGIGGWLVKQQGMATLNRAQATLARGAVPVDDLFDSVCLLAAGALLIMPGFISDAVAFCLLFPLFRKVLRERTPSRYKMHSPQSGYTEETIIEGNYVRVQEPVSQVEQKHDGNLTD